MMPSTTTTIPVPRHPDSVALCVLVVVLCLLCPPSCPHRHKHHHPGLHRQRNFAEESLQEVHQSVDDPSVQQRRTAKQIHCAHGSVVGGRCVCNRGFAGTHCERKMHCATFDRAANGSCPSCQPNFWGEFCERMACQHAGEEVQYEQKCECKAPYSGKFCEELLTSNVYYYYNSKVSAIGPLGVLAVIPMIGIYVVCERLARKRQVSRIEKTWNEQTHSALNPHSIEQLLREKR